MKQDALASQTRAWGPGGLGKVRYTTQQKGHRTMPPNVGLDSDFGPSTVDL